MRAVCNNETFGRKLQLVSRGVSARATIQLLGGILLEAEGETLKLSATDMEISIQTSSPAEVQEEGRVVIPARIFNDIVRSLPGGQFTLEHDGSEGTVRLAAGENEYRIRTYAADDYPQLPEFPQEGAARRPAARRAQPGSRRGRPSAASGPPRRTTTRSSRSSPRRGPSGCPGSRSSRPWR